MNNNDHQKVADALAGNKNNKDDSSSCAQIRRWVEEAIKNNKDHSSKPYASVSLGVYELSLDDDNKNNKHGRRSCTVHLGERLVPNDHSIYEIGSITKLFTALLLALAVQEPTLLPPPTVTLDTAVVDLAAELPTVVGSSLVDHFPLEITLKKLATHTSGLPRLPPDWNRWYLFWHSRNPYAAYHDRQLAHSLEEYRDDEPQEIGKHWEYSNFGVGLLAYTLVHTAKLESSSCLVKRMDHTKKDNAGYKSKNPKRKQTAKNETAVFYDSLIQRCITGPLNLKDTTVTLDAEQKLRFLPGYNSKGRRVHPWTADALVGCGALHGTLDSMLEFGAANLRAAWSIDDCPEDVSMAMRLTHQAQFDIPDSPYAMGLGWIREPVVLEQEKQHMKEKETTEEDSTINGTMLWHNGGTAGFSSFLGFCKQKWGGTVVVVLANTQAVDSTELGKKTLRHLIQVTQNVPVESTRGQNDNEVVATSET